ncbi:GntR family transcriptional regulator [Streptomyces sp. NPDC006365]|uniref:GntR family transcriptional regulator n=1 Tax=Streptomyces sp. NPDC006365 TaxID=3364744 RepID=UPI0036A950C2
MPEVKTERPPDLLPVRLPGRAGADSTPSAEALVRHVKEGLRSRQYTFGDVLPSESELQELYGATSDEVRQGIQHLRREGCLQLHDEYLETFILDPGTERVGLEPTDELAHRVARLESLCGELSARLATVESQLARRNRPEAR